MIFPDIRKLLPHADPMILLDRVISADKESLCAEVLIRPENLFYENTLDKKGVSAWIGIEYMAQTIGAYAGYNALLNSNPVKVGFLLGTRHYESNTSFFPEGRVLQVKVKCIMEADNGLSAFECTISDQHNLLANAIINVFLPDNLNKFLEEINLNE
jgi:predicted hotdog family 3-hydroxylacyl-ACP dehydratase